MKTFVPNAQGIFFDLPEHIYRSATGINISALKKMSISPAHYRAYIVEPRKPSTPAQVFGTLLHRAALEPHLLAGSYVVKPENIDYRTKVGKEWRDAQTQQILSQEEAKALTGCEASVAGHPAAQGLLTGSQKEVSVFKIHEGTGLMLKGRCDILVSDNESGLTIVADVKTTEDASPTGFPKSVANFGYHLQAAFYLDLVGATSFEFIAVEKEAPFAVAVYLLDSEAIAQGRAENERNLATLLQCQAKNEWPGYPDGVQLLRLPSWARRAE